MLDVTFLRNAGVIEILIYLVNYPGGRRKVDIRTDLGLNPATATRAHRILSQEGFLVGMTYLNATAYALSPKARKLATMLATAAKELRALGKKLEPRSNNMMFKMINKEYDTDACAVRRDDR